MNRRTITQVRAFRASVAVARSVCDGELTATILHSFGRGAWRMPIPRCVYRRRWERMDARLRAALADLPPPPPLPEGYVHGFSNGSEYDYWTARNCDRCALAGDPAVAGSSPCPMFEMIHDAAASDGLFPIALARRMGYEDGALHWGACPERTSQTIAEQAQQETERRALVAWNAWARGAK